jgi:dTDP-4-dehydrorhamnose 3,5-epimerase
MEFRSTHLPGACLIGFEPKHDDRGSFARTFCAHDFALNGLETEYPQHSISNSIRKGTLRGMHYQKQPFSEVKLVRCVKGAILDVIVDIRIGSPTYRRWQGFELSDSEPYQLYIPKGFAHGFQTLCDHVEVNYLMSVPYAPDASWGFRHDDPTFNILWPLPISEISERDLRWPPFDENYALPLAQS